jgi:hypothetical protein
VGFPVQTHVKGFLCFAMVPKRGTDNHPSMGLTAGLVNEPCPNFGDGQNPPGHKLMAKLLLEDLPGVVWNVGIEGFPELCDKFRLLVFPFLEPKHRLEFLAALAKVMGEGG